MGLIAHPMKALMGVAMMFEKPGEAVDAIVSELGDRVGKLADGDVEQICKESTMLALDAALSKGAGKLAGVAGDASKLASCIDDLPTGPVSRYAEATGKGRRVPNRITNVTRSEFERNLVESGFAQSHSADRKVALFEKDGARYALRSHAKSTGGPSADFYAPGSEGITLKIRLQEELP